MDESGRLERLLSPVGPDTGDRPRTARDWIVDGAAISLALAIGALSVDGVESKIGEGLLAADFVLGVLLSVALFWRRRHPVALLLAACLAAPFSASSAGAAMVLLFTVAVHRPPRVAVSIALLSLVPLPFYYLLHDPLSGRWVDAAFGLAFTAIAVAWGMFVRARRQLVLSLAERARDAEAGQQERVERARTDERARIAREMHDVLAHRLSLLSLHAGALEFRPDASPEEVTRTAGIIRAAAHDALSELRGVIGVLRSETDTAGSPEPPQPTLVDLDALLLECHAAGVRVDATVALAVDAVPTVLGRNAYRIVQEGLTNARKHAPGARVEVLLDGAPGEELRIEVRNPIPVGVLAGAGSVMPGAGTGLVGLTERAALAGGVLEHGLVDGAFRLCARLPWPS